tara:strand:+ start:205 stop:1551 length:1347 start_codon:yes stop_codon:yes gene_type:complete
MDNFWAPLHELIETNCGQFDSIWQKRKRVIDTEFLVIFICKLVLSKNKQGYASLLEELWENNRFSELQGVPVSASSICEARQKLPPEIFKRLNENILSAYTQESSLELWNGHRVFAVDGSKINLPRRLIDYGYKAPNHYQYYPKGLMSTLYHLSSGFIFDGILTSDKSERHCLFDHMDTLSVGDILVLDRGYFSYLVLYKAVEKGVHLICRIQSGNINKAMRSFLDSNEVDKVINYQPSASVLSEIKNQGFIIEPKPIMLRLTKYIIDDEVYLCATTLLDPIRYPLKDFSGIYHARWGIEELYKISKSFVEIEDFHGQTENAVKQECYAHLLLINLARIFELQAKKNLPPPTDTLSEAEGRDSYWQDFCGEIERLKINFKNCLLVLGRHLVNLFLPDVFLEQDYLNKIVNAISRLKQKIRPGRHAPRQSRKPIKKWKDARGGKVSYAS